MATLVGEEVGAQVGDDVHDDQTTPAAEPTPRRIPAWLANAALAAIVVAGVLLRFYSRSNLWLDEALSVNISRLPVSDIPDALRQDGHPPLFYLLLHYWMELFGEGDDAVRVLSGIFGVAALPLAWIAGRRLAGTTGARWTLAVVALQPYWIRYSTETRMYSLVMLLVLAGYLLLVDALRAPRLWRLVAIGLITGLLLLTHYWAFWLVAAVGVMLLWRWWRRRDQRPTTRRILLAMAVGSLLFVPWLSGFLYQSQHTGTPWAEPVRPTMLVEMTLQDLGGGEMAEGKLGGALILICCLLALFVVRSSGRRMELDIGTAPTVRTELTAVALTAGIGCLMGFAIGATFQARYAAVFVPLVVLAAAIGITRVPGGPARLLAGGLFLVMSVGGIAWVEYYQRTQSGPVASAIAEHAEPGDVVIYCPDQLGPAFSREMPDTDLDHLAYPTLGRPDRVDWVDYADRNAAADPVEIAAQIRRDYAGQSAFLVFRAQYKTFEGHCELLAAELGQGQTLVSEDEGAFYEPANLFWVADLTG